MKPFDMLEKNLLRFMSKTAILDTTFQSIGSTCAISDPLAGASAREMLVVRLQDYWAQFVRELIVLSASGRAVTSSGVRLPARRGFSRTGEVRSWLAANRPNPNRDLDWHVASTSVHWSQRIGIANHTTVTAALGSTNSPEEQVRIYRNFVVHRTKETAERLRRDNFRRNLAPRSLSSLPLEVTAGGVPIFARWVKDFQLVAKVASA